MVSFLICLALLIGGYFVYGKVVENTFGPDDSSITQQLRGLIAASGATCPAQ